MTAMSDVARTSTEHSSSPTPGGSRIQVAGSDTPSIARERSKFEKWMRKRWGGVPLDAEYLGRDAFEYKQTAAQTAWEVWQRFTGLRS